MHGASSSLYAAARRNSIQNSDLLPEIIYPGTAESLKKSQSFYKKS